jgi:hypothetical protein
VTSHGLTFITGIETAAKSSRGTEGKGIVMEPRRKQKGQALAEYSVLIPGSIILSFAVLVVFGGGLRNTYDKAVGWLLDAFSGNVCVRETYITHQSGASRCDHNDNCDLLEPEDGEDYNSRIFTSSEPIHIAVIKAGQTYHVMNTGLTDDGCYRVQFNGNAVTWWKVGSESDCQDVSHVQTWRRPLCY